MMLAGTISNNLMLFFIVSGVAVVLLVIILIFLHKYEKKRKLANEIEQAKEFLANVKEDLAPEEASEAPAEQEVRTTSTTVSKDTSNTPLTEEEKTASVEAEESGAEEVSTSEVEEVEEEAVASPSEAIVEEASVTSEEIAEEEPVATPSEEAKPSVPVEDVDGASIINTKSTKFVVSILYSKSFNAQVVLKPNLKPIYKAINEEFLGYKNVHARLSFKGVRYSIGRKLLAKLFVRGKRLYLYYALDPNKQDEKYHLKDVSDKKIGEELPALQKVLSPRSLLYAKQLIAILMAENEVSRLPEDKIKENDYTEMFKPRSFKQLLEQGLIKAYQIKQEVPADKEIVNRPQIEIKPDEVDEYVSDEEADNDVTYKAGKQPGKQAIINIGVINDYFDEDDEVTLASLIAKHLVPKNTKQIKILAHGILDKGLNVVADEYSKQAIKMILYMGGTVTILK